MRKGMFEEATKEIKGAVAIAGPIPLWQGFLGQAYAMAGQKSDAVKMLRELTDASKRRYVPPVAFSLIYAGRGKRNQAFKWLDRAWQERDGLLIYLEVGSVFDTLRSDKRFGEFLKRVGLHDDPDLDVRHRFDPSRASDTHGPVPHSSFWRKVLPLTLLLTLVPLFAREYYLHHASSPSAPPLRMMLAVEPFRNVRVDSQAQPISEGLREELFTLLSQLIPGKLQVIELTPADAALSLDHKCSHPEATLKPP